jgi:hypothetical protein
VAGVSQGGEEVEVNHIYSYNKDIEKEKGEKDDSIGSIFLLMFSTRKDMKDTANET